MERLESVRNLVRAGRFAEGLSALESVAAFGSVRADAEVLRVELLERTGKYAQSRVLSERLLKSRNLSAAHRSGCEFVLGLILWNEGDTEESIVHLQRSLALAEIANDPVRRCWAQLRLMLALAGRSDPASVASLLAQTRWNTIKLGDPLVSAALHIFLGEMEARRGLTVSALRHTRLGQKLLESSPNVWLESFAENNHVAVSLMQCNIMAGLVHANRALKLAEESGSAAMRRACLGNLGNLHCLAGDFGEALDYFRLGTAVLPAAGEYSNAARESLARIHLLRDDVEAAVACLDVIDQSVQTPSDRLLYANRHAQLTRGLVLKRQNRLTDAIAAVDTAIDLAQAAGDHLLSMNAQLIKSELVCQAGRLHDAAPLLSNVVSSLPAHPPDIHAQYRARVGMRSRECRRARRCALALGARQANLRGSAQRTGSAGPGPRLERGCESTTGR